MRLFRFFILFCLFILSLLIFMPKANLYYLAEIKLKQYNVILSNEKFISHTFGFDIKDAKIFIEGVNIATIDNLDISLFKGIKISSKDIGYAFTSCDFAKHSIIIFFDPTKTFLKKYKIIEKYFTKDKKGRFKYEYKLF